MTAQWDDDIHHAIHSAVSGERQGYYEDFGSLSTLAKTLRNGYYHAGTYLVVPGAQARQAVGPRDHPGNPPDGVHHHARSGW